VQKDHHRHEPLGGEELGEVEAVVRQAVDGESPWLGFLLEDEQQSLAS
jgi:hypothetical protein